MTVKRFENRLNKDNVKFNTLNPVWDNEKQDALNVFEMIDLLNGLHEENENLQDVNVQCCNDYSAMRRDVLQYKEENEQLKKEILWWKYRCGEDISGDVE